VNSGGVIMPMQLADNARNAFFVFLVGEAVICVSIAAAKTFGVVL